MNIEKIIDKDIHIAVVSSGDIIINDANWKRYDAQFLATETTRNATFSIQCQEKGTLYLGFCSLMPAETFHGHGLRKDLAEKLEQMHPSFLRFPGGCIVEGFTLETAMFFCNTVGRLGTSKPLASLALSNYKWSGIP